MLNDTEELIFQMMRTKRGNTLEIQTRGNQAKCCKMISTIWLGTVTLNKARAKAD
jgi:hypothetical protein